MTDIIVGQVEPTAVVDVIEELRNHFDQSPSVYPREIVERIVQQKDYVTPKLLELLEKFATHTSRHLSKTEEQCGIIALFVLAEFRESKAFPLVLHLCKLPSDTIEFYLGDMISESIPEHLATTYNGDLKSICDIVTNLYYSRLARASVLRTIVMLYKHNIISRKEIVTVFASFFDALYDDFTYVPSALVSCCCDIHATELLGQINEYVTNNIVEFDYIDPEFIAERLSLSRKEALEKMQTDSEYKIFTNIHDEMKWLFRDDEEDVDDDFLLRSLIEIKFGRNEPCPCGSGKKYKKCCL
jgi:hypothetical protein